MTASADSSVPTKVLSHFYDYTFFAFSFILGKGIPAPSLFKARALSRSLPPF